MSLPNLITLARLILVPVIVWLIVAGQTQAACGAFLLAGLSDAADGFLAKRFNMETELGAYLDPLADKMLIVCIFVTLGILGHLPAWLVIGVVARDVLIVMAIVLSWMLGQPVTIKPLIVSKFNTFAQIVLAATVLADDAFKLGMETVRLVLIWVTAALTTASLGSYLLLWIEHMSQPADRR